MADAHVEIDGLKLDVDDYFRYIDTDPVYELPTMEERAEMNRRFGFPDKNGSML